MTKEEKEYQKKYYQENKRKWKIYNYKSYWKNRKKVLERVARYYRDNKDKISAYKKKWWKNSG